MAGEDNCLMCGKKFTDDDYEIGNGVYECPCCDESMCSMCWNEYF